MNAPAPAPPANVRSRMTRFFVVTNLATFVMLWWMQVAGANWTNAAYGMVPARLSADPSGESIKILTSLFVHDGFGHLLWNLVFLVLFGRRIERALGRTTYLAFYVISGTASALAQFAMDPHSPIPLVGASGAIAGILGGYLALFPREPLTIFNISAYKLIGAWFVINLLGLLSSFGQATTDTAFASHLGGFVAGLVLVRPLRSIQASEESFWPTIGEPPKIAKPPIFKRNSDGPFWRS